MKNLREALRGAEEKKIGIGHFNISELSALKGIFEAAKELNLPVIIGLSEGEREFFGTRQAAQVVKSIRDEFDYPIFINADHTHSIQKIKEAVEAGFDAVLFDGGKLSLDENISRTKEVVDYVRSANPEILVEGELGYIGASSAILEDIPEGAAVKSEDLTTAGEAERFVRDTGVDLLAPAVGNIHGMLKGGNPKIDILRIREIKEVVKIPLVLHGGSGIRDEEFVSAIENGISIIHINTEIRAAWRRGVEKGLSDKGQITPYKILPEAAEEVKSVVLNRLKIFSGIRV